MSVVGVAKYVSNAVSAEVCVVGRGGEGLSHLCACNVLVGVVSEVAFVRRESCGVVSHDVVLWLLLHDVLWT